MFKRALLRGRATARAATAVALAGVFAGAIVACGGGSSSSSDASGNGAVVVDSILDRTGPLNIYGKAMDDATHLAVKDINAHGGLLGHQLRLKSYDAASAQDKYTTYANQVALQDKPVVVMGGITSASREAIRPIFDRSRILYFYNELYEGGVCDRNTFLTGATPSQQLSVLIPWTIKNVGPRLYVVAADYNYGQISAKWVQRYAKQAGGQVIATKFFPLDTSDFGAVIADLQRTRPDAVVSLLVGANHVAFYRAFASTGLGKSMKVVSPTFGLGNEQVLVSPAEAKGITVVYPYFQELDNAVNKAFVQHWQAAYGAGYPYISDSAVYVWNGWHLWAAAVKKAHSFDRDKVIAALESGSIEFDSPSGRVTVDPRSHHVTQSVSLATTNSKHGFDVKSTRSDVPPSYEEQVCNLQTSPTTNKQFTP